MHTYCGVNCESCPSKENCEGCRETCGSPFGGRCVAAEYISLEAWRPISIGALFSMSAGIDSMIRKACFITALTVMENGEHWFDTDDRMRFLDD